MREAGDGRDDEAAVGGEIRKAGADGDGMREAGAGGRTGCGRAGGAGGEERGERERRRRRPGAAAGCRGGRRLRLRGEKKPYGFDTMLG